jgi:copper oxidase (laccase) domain-containing protein
MDEVIVRDVDGAIKIGYSGKRLGDTQAGAGPVAEANFARFKTYFPGKTVYDMPAGGKDNIVEIDKLSPEQLWELEADGLITRSPDNLLALKAADCIPLVFYVPGQEILALAHVGTPGAAAHLPSKMVKEINHPPDPIKVYAGPHISQKAYRFVDKDISDKKLDASWDSYITKESDGIHINLLGYVLDELKAAGIKDENIQIEDVDTGSDPNYFSHRRHKLTGDINGRNCFAVCIIYTEV